MIKYKYLQLKSTKLMRMKNFSTLLAVLALFSLKVSAQTSYDLKVNGIAVTSDNAAAITGDGITGTVKYDATSKVLTLDNATIAATGGNNAITSHTDGLTIELVGTNTLSSASASTVCLFKETTIEGKGSASAKSGNSTAIQMMSYPLTVKGGCTVTASGIGGIAGIDGTETLTINASTIKASGFAFGAISDCSVDLIDCKITSGSYYDEDVTIEPTSTGINTVSDKPLSHPSEIYNAAGMRLDHVPATGIYIKGGKKVLAGRHRH